jgi:hypothetical protein
MSGLEAREPDGPDGLSPPRRFGLQVVCVCIGLAAGALVSALVEHPGIFLLRRASVEGGNPALFHLLIWIRTAVIFLPAVAAGVAGAVVSPRRDARRCGLVAGLIALAGKTLVWSVTVSWWPAGDPAFLGTVAVGWPTVLALVYLVAGRIGGQWSPWDRILPPGG